MIRQQKNQQCRYRAVLPCVYTPGFLIGHFVPLVRLWEQVGELLLPCLRWKSKKSDGLANIHKASKEIRDHVFQLITVPWLSYQKDIQTKNNIDKIKRINTPKKVVFVCLFINIYVSNPFKIKNIYPFTKRNYTIINQNWQNCIRFNAA